MKFEKGLEVTILPEDTPLVGRSESANGITNNDHIKDFLKDKPNLLRQYLDQLKCQEK
jgi:hypothetical protein